MPNINQAAKTWQLELAGRFGAAVQARRKALKITAQQLAERTRKLGYPVTRVAISKIETNNRAGKFDLAELFVLSVALDIPPALLLFPGYPDGRAELLPGVVMSAVDAAAWLVGDAPLSGDGANDGTKLIAAMRSRERVDHNVFQTRMMLEHAEAPERMRESYGRALADSEQRLQAISAEITEFRTHLWGEQ
jgi:transcriptional regulator with XRE-family HTH domain